MPVLRQTPKADKFNLAAQLPFELRVKDVEAAMQDAYDFFFDVNRFLDAKGLPRLDDMLRPAAMSGVLSDLMTDSLAKHSRVLTINSHHNGHPDLVVRGRYPNDAIEAGELGVEVKSTRKKGGAVDTHGARDQYMCVFVYAVDNETEPASERRAMTFTEVYLGQVTVADFRHNARGELGTRTATLHAEGIAKLRQNWIYLDQATSMRRAANRGKASAAKAK
jgi:hypothetical protein